MQCFLIGIGIFFYYIQLVQPAYDLMLEHILEGFKKALNYALNGGHGFALVARECTINCMRVFDENCLGIAIKYHSSETIFFF